MKPKVVFLLLTQILLLFFCKLHTRAARKIYSNQQILILIRKSNQTPIRKNSVRNLSSEEQRINAQLFISIDRRRKKIKQLQSVVSERHLC